MSLIRLIYTSHAELDLRLSDIKEILATARTNNHALDVCGMLFYNAKYFLQALEGEEQNVQSLFDKIAEDFRHEGVHIISREEITQPLFSDWSMGYTGNTVAVDDTLRSMDIDSDDLTQLNAQQCLTLLTKMGELQALDNVAEPS